MRRGRRSRAGRKVLLRFCREIREEGIRGTVSVLKELNIPLPTILAKIQEQYGPSLEMSKKYL